AAPCPVDISGRRAHIGPGHPLERTGRTGKTMTDETKKQDTGAQEAAEELAETLKEEPAAQGEAAPDAVAGPDIAAIEAENADLRDRLLRAAAEMENTRKRAEREKQDAVRYANAGFGRDML